VNVLPSGVGEAAGSLAEELGGVREQIMQARALLAQLNEAVLLADRPRGGPPATELLAANEQLVVAALRSETRFRAYFDVSPEYLFLLRLTPDDRLIFEDVNPAGADLYGLSRDEIVGRTAIDIDSEEGAESINRNGRLALLSGRTMTYEVSRTFRSRPLCTINVIVAPVEVSENGGFVLVCGRDLTEQRQAEEALRQSQKMEAIGQLTGGIAHDFNNLLAAVMGSLELMQSRIARGRVNEIHRYVATAQKAVKRAAALTHRLLAFSRRQTLSPTLTDLNHLVKGMEDLIRRTIGPQIELDVIAGSSLWMTQVDQNQLENALLNLCINARDAMPDGGRVTVETANFLIDERMASEGAISPGQYVALSVSDTGYGMTPEVMSRAFDPFFTTKPMGSGTGLGLSMIYGFAKQSGGQVRIYSETGRGAMVCIYFPHFVGGGEPARVTAELVAAPRATPGEAVLVVDDEELVRLLMIDVLEDLGYSSLEAGDARSGLTILRSNARIDLLVTDVGLPGGMNGRQLAEAARTLRPELKILFITGYAENAVISHDHLESGMQIMIKPFAMEALGAKVSDMIRHSA
jgi:PAS domain S-box-containing protein